jgi:hypothetical protein
MSVERLETVMVSTHYSQSSASFSRHFSTVVAAVALGGLMLALRRTRPRPHYFQPVRDAGPENMENPPADWDEVDEGSDQSFPASDPPVHCMRSPKES